MVILAIYGGGPSYRNFGGHDRRLLEKNQDWQAEEGGGGGNPIALNRSSMDVQDGLPAGVYSITVTDVVKLYSGVRRVRDWGNP